MAYREIAFLLPVHAWEGEILETCCTERPIKEVKKNVGKD